jgi:integrase/recombinase XerC
MIAITQQQLSQNSTRSYEVEQLLRYYQQLFEKGKGGAYLRVAKAWMYFCVEHDYALDPISFGFFVQNKSRSYKSMGMKFLRFCEQKEIHSVYRSSKKAYSQAVNQLVEKFLEGMRGKLKGERSLQTYNRALTQYFHYLNAHKQNISRESVVNFLDWLKLKSLKPSTINLYLSVIKQLLRYVLLHRESLKLELSQEQLHELRDILLVEGLPLEKGFKKESLSEQELLGLIGKVAENHQDLKERADEEHFFRLVFSEQAMIALMGYCGLRTVELCRLQLKDIDLEAAVLWVHGKGRAEKIPVRLFSQAAEILREYLNRLNSSPHDLLFPGLQTWKVRQVVNFHLKACGLKQDKLTAHSLRHTCAQILKAKGLSDRLIQRQLRHARAETTALYTLKQDEKEFLVKMPEDF